MKHLLLILIFIPAFSGWCTNNASIDRILNSKINHIEKLEVSNKEDIIFISTHFSKPEILNPEELKKINDRVILKIGLAFTTYRYSDTFIQRELNRKRLTELNRLAPGIPDNSMITWELIAQTGAASPEEGNGYFHGFVITLRPHSSKALIEKELSWLTSVLEEADASIPEEGVYRLSELEKQPVYRSGEKAMYNYLNSARKYPAEAAKKGISGTVKVSFVVNKFGELEKIKAYNGIGGGCDEEAMRLVKSMPGWIPGEKDGETVDALYTVEIDFSPPGKQVVDGISKKDRPAPVRQVEKSPDAHPAEAPSDSTVFRVLNRNQWEKMAVVCDLTGSMSPFTVQLLTWFRKTMGDKQKIACFTFFNDGDDKSSKEKETGNTGGIYHIAAIGFEEVKKTAIITMKNGFGGDLMENNMEAVLSAIKACPDAKELVMIADNYASPRDLQLTKQVKKPIRLILCGTTTGLNTDYLDMVRENKGSLHTEAEDIYHLEKLREGDQLSISGTTYQIRDERFHRID